MTPSEMWSAALADKLVIPRLRITALSNHLASDIGSMGINYQCMEDEGELSSSGSESDRGSESDAEAECESDVEAETADGESNEVAVSNVIVYIPDQSKYPLLHSLLSWKPSANTLNQLINEIVKFSGGNTIKYTRGNNTEATLLSVPFFRNILKYQKEFTKDNTLIDAAVKSIAKSAKIDEQEAAESLLSGLCSKYEDAFVKVALNNDVLCGLPCKKMNAVSVEAMLCDCGINATNARTLFRHLHHFFGKSYFESEHKRRAYFGNNDFPPTVKKIELEDKTWVYFWFKQPDLLLQHQIDKIVNATDLEGIVSVDIATGGDHGGGRFRMLMKIVLRFTNTPPISRNYEVANVSHSQDNIEVLKITVLD
jgi:hypothetical protein